VRPETAIWNRPGRVVGVPPDSVHLGTSVVVVVVTGRVRCGADGVGASSVGGSTLGAR
jgi:hypothetical protein